MDARLVLVVLAVSDVERATRFYADSFGWRRAVETPVYCELALPGGMRVGLYQREGFGKNVGRTPQATPSGELASAELYVAVASLDAAVAALLAAGAVLLSPAADRPWGDRVAYFADPDRNVVAVATTAGGRTATGDQRET